MGWLITLAVLAMLAMNLVERRRARRVDKRIAEYHAHIRRKAPDSELARLDAYEFRARVSAAWSRYAQVRSWSSWAVLLAAVLAVPLVWSFADPDYASVSVPLRLAMLAGLAVLAAGAVLWRVRETRALAAQGIEPERLES